MLRRSASITMAGLTLGGLLLIGSPAGAQTFYNPYNIDQREDYQQQRIQQGIDSGALTSGEARYLGREQARIQADEDRMRADGRLAPWERQRLNQMQNQAGRDIYRLEHNGRTAEGWGNGNHYGWGDRNHYSWGGHSNSGWGGNNYSGWGGRVYDPRYDRREDRQQYRIQKGIHSGALSPGEARYLDRQQGRIQATEDRMRADGRLSPWERQRLNQMQNRASRDIYRLDHNGRTAEGYAGNHAGWQGNNNGGSGRGYGWQGNNSGGYGATPSGTPITGATSGGTTTAGTIQGWRGNHSGWNGSLPSGTAATGGTTAGGTTPSGTTTTGNTQGWRGNYARNSQASAFQQPGVQAGNSGQPANWQGQPRFQQARPQQQMPQTMIRPNTNTMARQTGGLAGLANRANSSLPRVAPRRQ